MCWTGGGKAGVMLRIDRLEEEDEEADRGVKVNGFTNG